MDKSDWSECYITGSVGNCIGTYNRTRLCNISETVVIDYKKVEDEKLSLFGENFVCGTSVEYYYWTGLKTRSPSGFESHKCHDKLCSKHFHYIY